MPDLVSQLGRKFREDREDLIRFVGFAVVFNFGVNCYIFVG